MDLERIKKDATDANAQAKPYTDAGLRAISRHIAGCSPAVVLEMVNRLGHAEAVVRGNIPPLAVCPCCATIHDPREQYGGARDSVQVAKAISERVRADLAQLIAIGDEEINNAPLFSSEWRLLKGSVLHFKSALASIDASNMEGALQRVEDRRTGSRKHRP